MEKRKRIRKFIPNYDTNTNTLKVSKTDLIRISRSKSKNNEYYKKFMLAKIIIKDPEYHFTPLQTDFFFNYLNKNTILEELRLKDFKRLPPDSVVLNYTYRELYHNLCNHISNYLENSTTLKVLEISGIFFHNYKIIHKYIGYSNNDNISSFSYLIKGLCKSTSLEELYLDDCNFRGVDEKDFEKLFSLNLKVLSLNNNKFMPIKCIKAIEKNIAINTNLNYLSINKKKKVFSSIDLNEFKQNVSLKQLYLAGFILNQKALLDFMKCNNLVKFEFTVHQNLKLKFLSKLFSLIKEHKTMIDVSISFSQMIFYEARLISEYLFLSNLKKISLYTDDSQKNSSIHKKIVAYIFKAYFLAKNKMLRLVINDNVV